MKKEDIIRKKMESLIEEMERIEKKEEKKKDIEEEECLVWEKERIVIDKVRSVKRVDIELISGVDLVSEKIVENKRRLEKGFKENNVLIWGERGMGK